MAVSNKRRKNTEEKKNLEPSDVKDSLFLYIIVIGVWCDNLRGLKAGEVRDVKIPKVHWNEWNLFFEYEQWEYEYNAIFLKKKIGKNLQTANDTLPTPIEPF